VRPGAAERPKDVLFALLIAILATALYLLPALLDNPVTEVPEARVACVAREMLESNDWLNPTLGGKPRLMKPPLPYWMTALTAKALSHGEIPGPRVLALSVRLPAALLSGLAVFLVTLYGAFAISRTVGVAAGLIFGFCAMLAQYGQLGYCDLPLTCFCAIAICASGRIVASPRPGLFSAIAFGIGLGGAILSKEHIPFMFLVPTLLVEIALRKTFNARKVLLYLVGVVIALAIAAPWYVALEKNQPGILAQMYKLRLSNSEETHLQDDRWTYYFYKLAGYLLPWTTILIAAIPLYFVSRSRLDPEQAPFTRVLAREQFRYFAFTFVLGFIAFYAWPKQQEYYLLPLLPAFALAAGHILATYRSAGGIPEEALAKWTLFIGILGGLAIAAAPLWPELLRLMHHFKQADRMAASISPVLWALTIPAGLIFTLLHFVMARQWVEGRALLAVLPMGVLALVGLLGWNIYHAESAKATDDLYKQAPLLRKQIAAMGEDVHVYRQEHHNMNELALLFYMGQDYPVYSTLVAESRSDAAPKKRVLIGYRDSLKAVGLGALLPESGMPLEAVEIPADWVPGTEIPVKVTPPAPHAEIPEPPALPDAPILPAPQAPLPTPAPSVAPEKTP